MQNHDYSFPETFKNHWNNEEKCISGLGQKKTDPENTTAVFQKPSVTVGKHWEKCISGHRQKNTDPENTS